MTVQKPAQSASQRSPEPVPPQRFLVRASRRQRAARLRRNLALAGAVAVTLAAGAYWLDRHTPASDRASSPAPVHTPKAAAGAGSLLGVDSVQNYTPEQAAGLSRANFGGATPAIATGVVKVAFHYRSQLPDGNFITVYGRAYLPGAPRTNLPVFAFAPGTTGIGDKCAPSLENPKTANWANYDSHLATYASQGLAVVTTDYEGMRDPARIHHYMVGELEGRALLDSIRALRRLPQTKGRLNTQATFLGGYSQGGHAAFWADKISATYAPDVRPKGVVGFGPVMSVKQTLTDVTHGANINWFGPYVLYSYRDYYRADYGRQMLLPHREDALAADVPAHCIDTNISFWGHTPAGVYTPEFIQAMSTNQISAISPGLERDLDANTVGAVPTKSAKLINQGAQDNVVLPAQQEAAKPALCQSSQGPVQLKIYPHATHYTTMVQSFNDTVSWIRTLAKGGSVTGNCQ